MKPPVFTVLLVMAAGWRGFAAAGEQFRKHHSGDARAATTDEVELADSGRLETNFDFAWRFHLGEVDSNVTCAFPRNLTGYQCLGLFFSNAQTVEACQSACCSATGCEIWQFASPPQSQGLGCWVGQSSQCSPNSQWLSGARNASVRPPPQKNGPASRGYDDSAWQLVDVPHDGIVASAFSADASRSHGYLPFNTTWYRKHFNLPAEWKASGGSIWLYFEGVFHMTTVYVNGEVALPIHRGGYTSFSVRLDNVTTLLYGDGQSNENVVAVVASAAGGSGWWYEGGGIYRHTFLVRTPSPVHFVTHGINPVANVTGTISWHDASDPSKGVISTGATLAPVVEVVNDVGTTINSTYSVKVTIFDDNNQQVATSSASCGGMSAGEVKKISVSMITMTAVELWSPQRTYMYSMRTELMGIGGQLLDNETTSIGFRRTVWLPASGFYLNDEPYKWRGFCDHNDFAGVGVAVPERVNLFRAQTMRSVGGNSWRMSHNPPVPALLDILDRVGVIVWDENRDFYNTSYDIDNQRSMVKRDRHHPSVMCWSFCNEAGCESQNSAVGMIYRTVSKEEDPTRPVTGNMFSYGSGKLSEVVDIQGFSHQGSAKFDSFHHDDPNRPTIGSECCSCTTQRGEDVGNNDEKLLGNFNGDCLQSQTGVELSRTFVAGLLVWTLFDYYGEPAFDWPDRSSSFGAIDLAGFPKAAAFYYRAWWLHNTTNVSSAGLHDRPYRPIALLHPMSPRQNSLDLAATVDVNDGQFMIHVVQHWQPYVGGDVRTIHAHTNAPHAELFVNGASQGVRPIVWLGYAEWDGVAYAHGNLTAVAMDYAGRAVATHTVMSPGDPVALKLTVDAPNESTGTGQALVLDGFDTALIRASVLDMNGQVVPGAAHNITFTVVAGPGRVVAVGNGDPQCHEPNQASWRSAYHGLARALVRVTEHRSGSAAERERMLRMDAHGGHVTKVFGRGREALGAAAMITVQASTTMDGKVTTATVDVPVSTDASEHGVLAVAKKWMSFKQ